ncbi:putative cytochrome P450 [Stachybotrys elegans]|uniref:Cytochrome P450 n=1 Tax=Stachybotrys elegans TaxID=80388 RepID=A0A8K0WN17_9HYPO|nr:putative cytochrome P450 [Stachybotrys elegans]
MNSISIAPGTAWPFAAIGAGVGLHLGFFIRGEHHMNGVKYMQIATLAFCGFAAALTRFYGVTLPSALLTTSSISGYMLLGTLSSTLAYRLLFHPLRRFPGPFGAQITSLWFSNHVYRNADAHKKSLELYKKYGTFVRVGSNDLMIVHPLAVPVVHGLQSKCRKASWYDEDWPRASIHTSRDHQFHHSRRRVWSQAFSDKALRGYENRIVSYNRALIDRLYEYGGQPVNAAKWFNYYSFDVMGDLAFGRDFDMLSSGQQHWAVGLLEEAMSIQGLKLPTWIFRMLVAVPGLTEKYWRFIHYCDEQLDLKIKGEKESENPDLMSTLLEDVGSQPSKQDMLTLRSDSRTIIVAGSDTTAATLSHIFWQLASHPEHIDLLRKELAPLASEDGTFEHQKIQHADHLNAIINETLRLNPVPPTAIVRKTPPEGIFVDGTFIPGNMHVWTPQYVIGRSEIAYERPYEFIPERWYSKPGMIKEKAGYAPFSTGPYGCIGRPLALMQLRLVIADCITKFDIGYPKGHDGSGFIDNVKDRFTWGLAELILCFRPRSGVEANESG